MSALEFVELAPGVSYVKAPTAIGVVRNGKRAALVDTGLDDNLVRKVVNHLSAEGVQVEAIVNTHSHADHFGGNAWTLGRAKAEVWAPAVEHHFIEHPALEPHTLWGALPFTGLSTKWLQAAPSPVHHVVDAHEVEILGLPWKFHSLAGHSPNQAAVEVAGAVFLSDSLLPPAILEKYGIVFAVDPGPQRESAKRVLSLGSRVFQTYHGGIVEDLPALVDANVRAIDRVRELVLAALAHGPRTAEEVFHALAREMSWSLSVEQHALNFATVRAYLSRLERDGRVAPAIDGPRLAWSAR